MADANGKEIKTEIVKVGSAILTPALLMLLAFFAKGYLDDFRSFSKTQNDLTIALTKVASQFEDHVRLDESRDTSKSEALRAIYDRIRNIEIAQARRTEAQIPLPPLDPRRIPGLESGNQ